MARQIETRPLMLQLIDAKTSLRAYARIYARYEVKEVIGKARRAKFQVGTDKVLAIFNGSESSGGIDYGQTS